MLDSIRTLIKSSHSYKAGLKILCVGVLLVALIGMSMPLLLLKKDMVNNVSASNPTYQEVFDTLIIDKTDELEYIPGEFMCSDFAVTLHNNFERNGVKCAVVQFNLPYCNGHVACAVMTTDKGLWFIEPQDNLMMNEGALFGFKNRYLGFPVRGYLLIW